MIFSIPSLNIAIALYILFSLIEYGWYLTGRKLHPFVAELFSEDLFPLLFALLAFSLMSDIG